MRCVMPPNSPGGHMRLPDGIQQGRLSMVDMTHDGDDRRPRLQLLRLLFHRLDLLLQIALFNNDLFMTFSTLNSMQTSSMFSSSSG